MKAFRFAGKRTGIALSITVYVGSRSTARTLIVGIFASNARGPGRLLASGSLSRPKPGAWNTVIIKSVAVKAGRAYWVAVLARGGTLYFRERQRGSCSSESYSQVHFTTLRSSVRLSSLKGRHSHTCPISVYVSGKLSTSGRTAPPVDGSPNTVTSSPTPPVNTARPTISRDAAVGDALIARAGAWTNCDSGACTFTYQWEHCDGSPASCTAVSGAAYASYTLQASDVGDTIDVVVTGTNAGGSASASSVATGMVVGGSGSDTPPPGVTLQAIDGGSNYYCSHNFTQACSDGWDSPTFFPIGPFWGAYSSEESTWAAVHWNTAFYANSQADVTDLANNGLYSIISAIWSTPDSTPNDNTVGFESVDEPGSWSAATAGLAGVSNSQQDSRFWWVNDTWEYGRISVTPTGTPGGTTRLYFFRPGRNAERPARGTLIWVDRRSIGSRRERRQYPWTSAGGQLALRPWEATVNCP